MTLTRVRFFSRIVRNKAAERAKGGSSSSATGCGASSPVSQTIPTSGMTGSSMIHDNVLNRPSYSINGILGIPQQDANANINKRKRDDDGEQGLPVS